MQEEFHKVSRPHLSRLRRTQVGRSEVVKARSWGTRAGPAGGGRADSGLGRAYVGARIPAGDTGVAGGHQQPSLPTGFLGGRTQAGAFPQGILVVTGAAPAPGISATDAAHSRDTAAAAGHVAATDGAGPKAIATAATGAADDGCRGRAGQYPLARAGGTSWSSGLGGGSDHI